MTNLLLDALVTTTEGRIEAWRGEARIMAAQSRDALEAGSVDPEHLVFAEQLAAMIYEEMDNLERSKAALPEIDADDAMTLAGLSDALRLVLLEITELGNRMYSVRPLEGAPLPAWILRAESLQIPVPPVAAPDPAAIEERPNQ